MTPIRRFLGLTLTLAVAAACSSSGSGHLSVDSGSGGGSTASGGAPTGSGAQAGASGASAGNVADSGPVPVGPYPPAPYGNIVGATLTNLQLQGYVNATGAVLSNTLPWTTAYSLDDVRKSGKPYALIHVSDFNCAGCRHAANQLGIDGKGILDAGGAVLEILSAKSGAVTVQADLNAWVTSYNLSVSSFIDAASSPTAALQVATIRETVFIVQMPSMKIVWTVHGDTSGVKPNSVIAAGAEMHKLLGK